MILKSFQMSNNSNASPVSYSLSVVPYYLNIYFGSFLWLTGNFGCIGNMMIFRSRTFRKRAYSIYLFGAAIADFHYFNFVLLTRILQKGFQISLINQYLIICKLRQFSTIWGNVVGFSLFIFATFDRLLSTQRSNKYRRWSNQTTLAYLMIFLIPLFWFILLVHRIILYRIENNQCIPPPGIYQYYDNYFQVIFSSLTPAISMSILAFLLIKSVRGVVQRRIGPENIDLPSVNQRSKSIIHQMDSQLTIMLILESIIAIITYFPYAIELTYSNITASWPKSPLRKIYESICTELIHLFSYIFFATSFYVSILSNIGFRRKIKRLFRQKRRNQNDDHSISYNVTNANITYRDR